MDDEQNERGREYYDESPAISDRAVAERLAAVRGSEI
jgi:hypothetical protein